MKETTTSTKPYTQMNDDLYFMKYGIINTLYVMSNSNIIKRKMEFSKDKKITNGTVSLCINKMVLIVLVVMVDNVVWFAVHEVYRLCCL